MAALKRFLKLRDSNPIYDDVKQRGAIGIPTLIIDDEIMIDIDKEKIEKMLNEEQK